MCLRIRGEGEAVNAGDFQLVFFKEVPEALCSHPGVGGEAIACYQRISRTPAL